MPEMETRVRERLNDLAGEAPKPSAPPTIVLHRARRRIAATAATLVIAAVVVVSGGIIGIKVLVDRSSAPANPLPTPTAGHTPASPAYAACLMPPNTWTANTCELGDRDLFLGAVGPDVMALEQRMAGLGFFTLAPDRTFDLPTKDDLRAFQVCLGLTPDGYADIHGQGTIAALQSATASEVAPCSTTGALAYAGTWLNDDPENAFAAKLTISVEGRNITVRVLYRYQIIPSSDTVPFTGEPIRITTRVADSHVPRVLEIRFVGSDRNRLHVVTTIRSDELRPETFHRA